MKHRMNDYIALLSGSALSGGSLMMAFYAGMQTEGSGYGPLILAGVMMPLGFLFTWSGAMAITTARKEAA